MARWQHFRAGLPAVFLAGGLLLGPATRPAAALALTTPPPRPTAPATATAMPAATTSPTASPTATATATATPIPPSVTATATAIISAASATPGATATAVPAVGTPTAPASDTPTVGSPAPLPTPGASSSPAPGTRTPTPTASPPASPTRSPVVTATISPTASATAGPTVTATVSPTPGPVRIGGITPASATNTAALSVTIAGSGFAPGQVVTIGGRPLTNVQVLSPAQIVGTLPAGLCPGSYAADVTPPGGSPVAGGRITLHGVQSAAFAGAMPSWSIVLDGTDQRRQLRLAPIQIVDTTCSSGDWRVQVAVTASTEHGKGHPTLLPQSLVLTAGAAGPASTLDLRHAAAGVVAIPRPAGATGVVVTATMTVLVPAGSYAGALTLPIAVTLLAGG